MNANGSGKGSPLLVAANAGNKEIAELLIEKGADVNSADDDGSTSLDWAESEENKEVAALLRKHGGKTGAELWAEESYFGAASLGDIEAVKKHLATGTDVNLMDEEYGAIPLHRAAGGGHKEVVALLITKGADVNIKDVDSETPLDWAESEEHKETADILRKHGGKTGEELEPSEANTEASLGESPMEVQAEATGFDVSDISIFLAADAGNIGAVKKHLASGENVNSQDPELATPLHYAASGGHKEVADFFIEKGATVNALGVHGTPLDNAIRQNHTEVAELLRKHGGKTGEELKAEGK